MPSSPTPSEQERADAEVKAREAKEQAKLPYTWSQTIKDVDLTIPVPAETKGRDVTVELTKTRLKVALKGQDPIIDVITAS